MNSNDIIKQRIKIQNLIITGNLFEAFRLLHGISESLLFWEITEKIKTAEENYKLMLQYAVKGVEDPDRDYFIESTGDKLLTLFNLIILKQRIAENDYHYHINKAREIRGKGIKLESLINEYRSLANGDSDYKMSDKIYELEKDLFYSLWASENFNERAAGSLTELINDMKSTYSLKSVAISAILLRSLTLGFSYNQLSLLLDVYLTSSVKEISVQALVASVIIILHYNKILPKNLLKKKFQDIEEKKDKVFRDDLFSVIIECLRTLETEQINKKMRDDIIPTMMKMGSKIRERFSELDEDELKDMEGNPEWEDLFEKSGLADSLQELNRLQVEGADVMMSTFGHLKTFPFFNEVYSWFIPFSPSQPEVSKLIEKNNVLKRLLKHSRILCDSDLYSFVFSFSAVPGSPQLIKIDNVEEQFAAFEEQMSAKDTLRSTKMIANRYIKNLYRFFKLYRRKDEFTDPFINMKNPVEVTVFKPFIDNRKCLEAIASFYFRHELWNDAVLVFKRLEEKGDVSVQLYQQLGYCFQKRDSFDRALDYYTFADALEPDNKWTVKKLAFCARKSGRLNLAVEYYKKLESLDPDDSKIPMYLGKCYMELGEYKNAISAFFKAYYQNPDSVRPLYNLVNAMMYDRQLDNAEKYLLKLLDSSNVTNKFILAGHYHFLREEYAESLNYYSKFLTPEVSGKNEKIFEIYEDLKKLSPENISAITLVVEQLRYNNC